MLTAATSERMRIIRLEYIFPTLLSLFNLARVQVDLTSGARLLSISSFSFFCKRESLLPILQTQSAFHPLAQRNASRRRGVRQ